MILRFVHTNRNGVRPKFRKFAILCCLMLYIAAVFYATGAGTVYDLARHGGRGNTADLNLSPFTQELSCTSYALNILLFVPLGFVLPCLWPGACGCKNTFLYGLSFSVLIEASQLANFRRTDIDDVLMNTLGALLGYLIYKAVMRIAGKSSRTGLSAGYEPAAYILAAFAGHFLLYNGYWLANLRIGY